MNGRCVHLTFDALPYKLMAILLHGFPIIPCPDNLLDECLVADVTTTNSLVCLLDNFHGFILIQASGVLRTEPTTVESIGKDEITG